MKAILSTLSVKVKLFIPVTLLAILLVIIAVLYQQTQSTISSVKSNLASVNQTTESLSLLFGDSEKFVLTRQGYDELNSRYTSMLNTMKNSQEASQQNHQTDIQQIQQQLSEIHRLFTENDQLLESVKAVFTNSIKQSNDYMDITVNKLIDPQQRNTVTTFERQVMVAALEHTDNNYKIWLIFEKLSKDINYAKPLFTYLSQLDKANDDAIKKLQGTPALAKAEAAGKANRELRKLANAIISNQENVNKLHSTITHNIDNLLKKISALGTKNIDSAFNQISNSMLSVIILLALVLAIVIVLTFIFASSIVSPLQVLIQRINELGNKGGDLTYRIEMERTDEIGLLAKGINTFISSLHTIFSGVTAGAHQIAGNANNSAISSQQTVEAMTHQQQENIKVQDAFHQMQSAISEIATNASTAATVVNNTVDSTKQINNVIKVMVSNINSVTEDLESAMTEIESLNRDSQNIGSILETIQGISEQTNLLALNAAIEAARAGEQGRGFAVVADEVRTLAQRTQESTEEINAMISTLQSTASRVGDVIRGGNETVIHTNDQTRTVVDGVTQISDLIANLSDMNLLIASAVEQQSSVTQDINHSMQQINEISNTCTQAARTSSDAANAQQSSVKELQSLISQFKV